jgi:hypothetical protein
MHRTPTISHTHCLTLLLHHTFTHPPLPFFANIATQHLLVRNYEHQLYLAPHILYLFVTFMCFLLHFLSKFPLFPVFSPVRYSVRYSVGYSIAKITIDPRRNHCLNFLSLIQPSCFGPNSSVHFLNKCMIHLFIQPQSLIFCVMDNM